MQHTDKQKVLFLAKQEALEQGFERAAAEDFVTVFIKNFEESEKIGAEKERLNMVKGLLQAGIDVKIISDTSGLTIQEIEKLKA